jgi:hypothetical protein
VHRAEPQQLVVEPEEAAGHLRDPAGLHLHI